MDWMLGMKQPINMALKPRILQTGGKTGHVELMRSERDLFAEKLPPRMTRIQRDTEPPSCFIVEMSTQYAHRLIAADCHALALVFRLSRAPQQRGATVHSDSFSEPSLPSCFPNLCSITHHFCLVP